MTLLVGRRVCMASISCAGVRFTEVISAAFILMKPCSHVVRLESALDVLSYGLFSILNNTHMGTARRRRHLKSHTPASWGCLTLIFVPSRAGGVTLPGLNMDPKTPSSHFRAPFTSGAARLYTPGLRRVPELPRFVRYVSNKTESHCR